jgi:thymidylate synthase
MNNIDKSYQTLLQDILDNGVNKCDRTGTGTLSVFGRQIRHKMSEGFPLLTTKKMAWNVMVAELLWFLRGDTNIKFLLDYDCHIWDGDAYKNYSKQVNDIIDGYRGGDIMGIQPHIEAMFSNSDKLIPLTQSEFINKIKTDDTFAKQWGELGPIYGRMWRKFDEDSYGGIDQIQNLIDDLKTNPDSRRLMVTAWHPGYNEHSVLPPCHYGFQVYTRELSLNERIEYGTKRDMWKLGQTITPLHCDSLRIPTRAISLMWNQRSVDTFLGLPFNIASYGLLLEIIAKEVNMIPDELIGNLGDVHLYSNHIEQAKEQIGRELTLEERMHWWFENHKPNRDVCDHIDEQSDYAKGVYFDSVGVPTRTREPYDLPKVEITERNWYLHHKVKEHLGEKSFDEKIMSYRPDCFELIGYTSHPKIKAPLSN